jgi:small-conductance mechanosensitive channel
MLILFSLLLAVAPAARPGPPPQDVEPATVRVWNRDVVEYRASIGHITPTQRARMAVKRIEGLPETALSLAVHTEPIELGDVRGVTFGVGPYHLMALLEDDLDPLGGETLEQAGEQVAERLRTVLAARAAQRNLPLLLKGIGVTLGSGLLLAALLWLLVRGGRRLVGWAEKRTQEATPLKIGGVDLREHVSGAVRNTLSVVVWVIGLVAAYSWLSLSFAQFPYTAPWADALGRWILDTTTMVLTGFLRALPGLGVVVVIFLIARAMTRLARTVLERVEKGQIVVRWLTPETARATRRLIGLVIWVFALVFAYPYMPGSGSDAFRGVSVLVGLMVSLGSAGLVNQVMSGFVVLYSRSVSTGEQVRIGDVEGVVSELGMLTTKIVTPTREEVTIPNALVVTSTTHNYSRRAGRGSAVATLSMTIGYDAPWRQVRALMLLAASRTEGVRENPKPRVVQRSLSDFYVEYQLITLVEPAARRAAILSKLRSAVLDAFNEHDVQIMSPHFVAQPGTDLVVPPERWFEAPAAGKPEDQDQTEDEDPTKDD